MALRTRSRLTALAIAATALLTVAGVAVSRADPTPSLPPVAADRLLGSALSALAHPYSISGDVQTTVDLGLPELPAGLSGPTGGSMTALASLTGTQRFRVWHSPQGVRVAHITDLGEQTVIADHTQVWLWDSTTTSARRIVYPDLAKRVDAGPPTFDPTAVAHRMLTSLAPYADVSVRGTSRVAGRSAYELDLVPSSPLTLIGRITIAIDEQSHLPLRVQVFAKDAVDPAVEATFTSASFDSIDPTMFTFSPPAGARVSTQRGTMSGWDAGATSAPPVTRTFGKGFDTRVAIRLDQPIPVAARALLPYAGPLGSAMTIDAGGHTWLLFGAVGLDTLRADASSLS
jgi:outer membrane lipoprotein-sorting protein